MSLVDFSTSAKVSPVEFWSENTYTEAQEEWKYCYRFYLTERQMSPSEFLNEHQMVLVEF